VLFRSLNNDSGIPGTPCINASVTVTMGFPKTGLYFYPGKTNVGKLVIQDLGYPDEIVNAKKPTLFIPTPERLSALLPPRRPAGSKFDHGLALLVCGSRGLAGSATLVANAAMRTGCGMTHLAAPESIVSILSNKLTETVIHPLPETGAGTPGRGALPAIMELAKTMHAVCIGPGISHTDETGELVRALVSSCKLPMVLDADGINAYKGRAQELASHAGDLVITPHRGEWRRLFGDLPAEPVKAVEALKEKAREFRMTILLKGNPTIAADPDGNGYILPFGNSALAKAGSGDVLSGIIVSLAAQGASGTHAAILGAYLHGEAGTAASAQLGEYSVIPSDVVNFLHVVIRKLNEVPDGR
jgi:ADP-dependent NAD(P)H-hydrate dehydratase / NAD(P)H-hydrate epimerase